MSTFRLQACWVLSLLFVAISFANAQTTLTTGGTDSWNTATNWTAGVPTGTIDAIVAASVQAEVNNAGTPAYTGSLTLQSGSRLTIQNVASTENALGTGTVFMDSATLYSRKTGAFTISNDFSVVGTNLLETVSDNRTKYLTGSISGSGVLTLRGNGNIWWYIEGSNSFSGELIVSCDDVDRWGVFFRAPGSAGAGDVTQIPRPSNGNYPWIIVQANDVFADTGTLTLDGIHGSNKGVIGSPTTVPQLFIMDGSYTDTVGKLIVRGNAYPSGTYSEVGASGVDYQVSWFDGTGVLTVNSQDDDGTPPTAIFEGTGEGGSTTNIYVTEPITYTVTLDEPHTPVLTINDFSNAGSAEIEVLSVTPTFPGAADNLIYEVVAKPTSAGSLQLSISTTVSDLFGNSTSSLADDDQIEVSSLPLIGGELGVLKPWVNTRINPVTGEEWKKGDQYRLLLVTDAATNALSSDINFYNTFVQNAVSTSSVYPLLGSKNWKVIGSTETVDARDNTGTNPTTNDVDVAVVALDGATILALNNADLWDGSLQNPPLYNQDGVAIVYNQVATGTDRYNDGQALTEKFLGDIPTGTVSHGRNNEKDTKWIQVYQAAIDSDFNFYALSEPLTIISTAPKGSLVIVE